MSFSTLFVFLLYNIKQILLHNFLQATKVIILLRTTALFFQKNEFSIIKLLFFMISQTKILYL